MYGELPWQAIAVLFGVLFLLMLCAGWKIRQDNRTGYRR